MLRRLCSKGVAKALASTHSACAPWRASFPAVSAVQWHPQQQWASTRELSDSAAATAPAGENRKPDWAPGTPAPGRKQTIGEAFAAMQYHARGTRKVKVGVLDGILSRVTSEEELKYATMGLQLFKGQGIDLHTKTATLFVKACCKAGSPQTAVDALGEAGNYGLDREGVVSAHRFNYLLSQLYISGDSKTFTRAVAEARSRQQSLNARSHTLIAKFEAEERAKEEEAARAKAEKEEEELRAKAEATAEEARLKEVAEADAKRAEEQSKILEAQKVGKEDKAKDEAATTAAEHPTATATAGDGGDGEVEVGDTKSGPDAKDGEPKR